MKPSSANGKNGNEILNKEIENKFIKTEVNHETNDNQLNQHSFISNELHMNSTEQNQWMSCDFCQETFIKDSTLQRHIYEIHLKRKRDPTMADEENSLDSQTISKEPKKKNQLKPKVISEWSDDDIYNLLESIKATPMLWNVRDPKYRNKIERQFAWKYISEVKLQGKYKENEVHAKWSNMRIQFRGYQAKYRKTGCKYKQWKFFDTMDFISSGEDEQNPIFVANMAIADEESFEPFSEQNSISTPTGVKRRRLSQSSSVTAICPTEATEDIITNEDVKNPVINQYKQRQDPNYEDEFAAFGKYIAAELRCLSDLKLARRVRFKVARYLLDCIETENQATNSSAYVIEDYRDN